MPCTSGLGQEFRIPQDAMPIHSFRFRFVVDKNQSVNRNALLDYLAASQRHDLSTKAAGTVHGE